MARGRPADATTLLLAALILAGSSGRTPAADPQSNPTAVEFFEKEVRPILAERCLGCHGPKKQKGGLRLDSREAALAGGDTGPAVVPGNLDESLLVDAIRYGELYQMPPNSKLPEPEIAALTRWVERGAPWGATTTKPSAGPRPAFDLKARLGHWSFRPVSVSEPPEVRDAAWPLNAVDRFLLAELEAAGLEPAPEADRRTLIRRLSFDLIGLPPRPEDVEAFVADPAPDAYERLVERLLGSPHYGERWGRHWLDLVRYAETYGHEFDYDIPSAWRYRDYVVRAFNADLPYDRLVVEHVAGDLLPDPRRNPQDGTNESILGTGFFWMAEGTHSPVDVREDEVKRLDNQIDVLSKTFLGLTVACARCHDHMFDPISTRDYYALSGILRSTRHQHAFLDDPEARRPHLDALERTRAEIRSALATPALRPADRVAATLLASATGKAGVGDSPDAAAVARWAEALRDPEAARPGHPLHAWLALFGPPGGPPAGDADSRRRVAERLPSGAGADGSTSFEEFDGPDFVGWTVTGEAFGAGPSRGGELRVSSADQTGTVEVVPPGLAHSGLASERLQGVLRSRTFTIEQKYIHYLASGRRGRIHLVVDGFEKIRSPIYGGLVTDVDRPDRPRWYTQDVTMWAGHEAYIELTDGGAADYTQARSAYLPGDGYLAVDAIRFSGDPSPPPPSGAFARLLLDGLDDPTPEAVAARYQAVLAAAWGDWASGRLGDGPDDRARAGALGWFLRRGLIEPADPARLADQLRAFREVEAAVPAPTLGLASLDGDGRDGRVLIRGNHRNPGEVVPRRFLEGLAGDSQPPAGSGSGRLELARRIADPANPLTARVMVNRIWTHHFGVGLVPTPDDFGAMGQPPSHPALLDWLADAFVRSGWSIKAMHRLMVLSRAYRMRSTPDPEADRLDPNNRLLHRRNVRRLEAEALRDAILTVSGRLDPKMSGPSVPALLTPYMDGRGKPAASGPLDGDGRRSLYLNIRRNFLHPMLLAFDFPAPATTMGRRNVSNVPAQALILLNDPFVVGQAKVWASRVRALPGLSDAQRVERMFLEAFGRPPGVAERERAVAFVAGKGGGPDAWADLGHVLFNVKEFLFIP